MSRASGVDRIYPQFAFNPAKFPRDGVAHRNILVVLRDFDGDAFGPAVYHNSQSTLEHYNKLLFSDDPNDGIISCGLLLRTRFRRLSAERAKAGRGRHGRGVRLVRPEPGFL